MKFILMLAACAFVVTGYAKDPIQDIYKKARTIFCENDFGDDQKLLFAYYSKAIKKFDEKTLMQNPELVFRKALAWFSFLDAEEESFDHFKMQMAAIREDFAFVTKYAEKESPLFKAASLRKDFIDFVLGVDPVDPEDLIQLEKVFCETIVKLWVPCTSSLGKQLREELFENLQQSPDLLESFNQFVVLLEEDAELVLGHVKPDEIQILGVTTSEEDDQESKLSYVIKYSYPNGYEMTIETQL